MSRYLKNFLFNALLLLVGSLLSQPLNACSVCGCGDPLQSAGTVHPLIGAVRLGLEAVYLTATAQSDDNPTQTETLAQKSVNGVLSYSPTANLTVIGIVPFTEKDWNLSAGDDQPASAAPIGIGDINLGLRYFLVADVDFKNNTSQDFAVSGGSTLPTGDENAVDSNGDRFDQHAQLGTGEWGPYGGLLYSFVTDKWNFSANFNALFHTINPYGYHFGTAFTWGAQAQWHLEEPLAVSLAVEGRYADHDTSNGDTQTNTGGTVLDITPGLWWSPNDAWGLYAKIQVPIITGLFGIQTVGATAIIGTQFLMY